jgi:nucleotide-binding universal stress UspA family protein
MYRKILVAVDSSDASAQGLNEAIRLASDQRAQLCLVHVVEPLAAMFYPEAGMFADDLMHALREAGERVLATALARAKKRGITARAALVDNGGYPVANLVLSYAKKWHADLIVIGTHGRRGLSHLLLGSDAETILRSAEVPVLLVRAKPKRTAPKRKPG